MAGRRTSLASLAGAKVDDVPGKSDPLLLSLPLDKLVPTRFNPRRNFGTQEDLVAFGRVLSTQQLQPAVVVSRAAYLKLWPEEEAHVGDKPYVIANGERRWKASQAVGRPTLEVVHREDVARSRASFLDAVLSENNDREDLDPIERALGIETMVEQLGGAGAVADHYKKSNGWVSQQRKLLKLTPDLQSLVSSGDMPVRIGREIAGLPHDEQAPAWEAELARRAGQRAASGPRGRAAAKASQQESNAAPAERKDVESKSFTAVKREAIEGSVAPEPARVPEPAEHSMSVTVKPRVLETVKLDESQRHDSASGPGETVPAPRATEPSTAETVEEEAVKPTLRMPWDDGATCGDIARARTTTTEGLNMLAAMALGYGAAAIQVLESVLERLKKERDVAAEA